MSTFQADCPHCGTVSVAFTIACERKALKYSSGHWDTLAICGQCSRGVLASFYCPDAKPPTESLASVLKVTLEPPIISPTPRKTDAPEHTPVNVKKFYEQGMQCLPSAWDAAGSMFRKALEAGLKRKFPEIKDRLDLKKRIEKAASDQKLTPELAEWAHQVRLGGNEAVHDDDPFSREDAERLQVFTELVFLYLFTLPGRLDDARRAASAKVPKSP